MARHLVAAGRLVDEDPAQALAHALAARRLAARISAVREAVGLAAYHAGEWQMAIAELRTYQRISGRQTHLAVVADCERALGRPERAIDLHRTAETDKLAPAEAVELLIVAAGARRDLGQQDAAVAMLQVPELAAEASAPWAARLRYAYADALLAADRQDEARQWFARAAVADDEGGEPTTDAAERLLELDGIQLEEVELDEPVLDDEPISAEEALVEDAQAEAVSADEDLADESPLEEGLADESLVEEDLVEESLADEELVEEEPDPELVAAPAAVAEPLVSAYDLVIVDLDGVVYLGEELIPTAVAAIQRLRGDGPPVVFATNNASRGAGEVADLLTRLGIAASATDVLTSAAVAAAALAERVPSGATVLVVGADALADEVRQVGLRPVRSAEEKPSAVIQGYGPQVGWAELAEAFLAIQAGAQWVVTNTDRTLPSARGMLPGNGALVAALRTALEREPDLVVGKPEPALFAAAAQRAGARAPLVIGDRLDTDIEGANRAGMDSLLVLTGVSDESRARSATGELRPTYIAADLAALFAPVPS